MKTFKDNAGRMWTISIDIGTVKRVRSLLDVNLVAKDFIQVLEEVLSDPVKLCDVIYVLCKPDADKQGISDEDFGRAMAGDAIEHAAIAFLDALADFTPNPRDRARVQKVVTALKSVAEKSRDMMDLQAEAALADLNQKLTSGSLFGDSRGVLG